jgi:hypothetical protein
MPARASIAILVVALAVGLGAPGADAQLADGGPLAGPPPSSISPPTPG